MRSWRISRARVPPIAARITSSRWRAAARTARRLATFAHAISSTNTTAPKSARIEVLTSLTRSPCIGTTRQCTSAVFFTGYRSRIVAAIAFRLGLCLFERDAVLEPRDHAERAAVPRRGVEVETQRGDDVDCGIDAGAGRHQQLKARLEDADHLGASAAEVDQPSDDRRVAAVFPLPELVRQDGDDRARRRLRLRRRRRRARRGRRRLRQRGAVGVGEVAAEGHPHAQHRQQVRRRGEDARPVPPRPIHRPRPRVPA